jgi:hypothetical protein
MDATQELAEAQLKALVKVPGALRIITAEVHPDHREDRDDPRSRAKEGVNLAHHSAFVVHDVVTLDGPDAQGRWTASSAEGDWTRGLADALLSRLTEAGRG